MNAKYHVTSNKCQCSVVGIDNMMKPVGHMFNSMKNSFISSVSYSESLNEVSYIFSGSVVGTAEVCEPVGHTINPMKSFFLLLSYGESLTRQLVIYHEVSYIFSGSVVGTAEVFEPVGHMINLMEGFFIFALFLSLRSGPISTFCSPGPDLNPVFPTDKTMHYRYFNIAAQISFKLGFYFQDLTFNHVIVPDLRIYCIPVPIHKPLT